MVSQKSILLGIAGLFLGALLLNLSATTTLAQEKSIEKVPVTQSQPSSGEIMYRDYCAVCHGLDARGNGPAATALKVPAPDLTTLAKKNGGSFPGAHVGAILEFGASIAAHGNADMPIWGPAFHSLHATISATNRAETNERIANLTKFLQRIQTK